MGCQTTDEKGETLTGAVSLGDIPLLEKALQEVRPKLVIIDPLQAYLGAGVDMYRANEVRPILSALGNLAEKHCCAVICIRHLAKATSSKAMYSGMGSIDFSAAARSVIRAGEYEGERHLTHVKSSLAPEGKSIRYEVKDGNLNYLGFSDVTAHDMLAPSSAEAQSTRDDAKAFLEAYLEAGPAPADQVVKSAQADGISAGTLIRAKKELAVISGRVNTKGGGRGGGGWTWSLLDKDA